MKNVSWAHTVSNVRSENNVLFTNAGTVTVDQGFWTPQELVDELNTQLQTLFGTANTYAVFDPTNHTIAWQLGAGEQIYASHATSTMRDTIGLGHNTFTGPTTFTSRVFLADPVSVSFVSPQLQPGDLHIQSGPRNFHPFLTAPVTGGYLDMCHYEPPVHQEIRFNTPGITVAGMLDVELVDTATGVELTEVAQWSMQIEIEQQHSR